MLIPNEDNNIPDKLRSHKDEESILKERDIEDNSEDLVGKSVNAESQAKNMMSEYTPQNRLLRSELLLSFREVRFTVKEYAIGILVSNIKYYYPRLQNNEPFYPFYDQLNYVLDHYFVEFKITKDNIDKFLFELLMVPLTGKLSY